MNATARSHVQAMRRALVPTPQDLAVYAAIVGGGSKAIHDADRLNPGVTRHDWRSRLAASIDDHKRRAVEQGRLAWERMRRDAR